MGTAWVERSGAGDRASQIMILLVDEPRRSRTEDHRLGKTSALPSRRGHLE